MCVCVWVRKELEQHCWTASIMSCTDRLRCFWVSRSAVMRSEWRTEAMGEYWSLSRCLETEIKKSGPTTSLLLGDMLREIFSPCLFFCLSEQCVCGVTRWRRWWDLTSMAALQREEECPPAWVEQLSPIAAQSAIGTRWAFQTTVYSLSTVIDTFACVL